MAQPHDALFKAVFGQPEHAAAELRHVLPTAAAALVDWTTLEPLPGSFVDEELRDCHADLLFRARIEGRDARVYLLLEHESHRDPWTALQVLTYVIRIWQRFRREAPGAARLPPVVAVVVQHGEGSASGVDLLESIDFGAAGRAALATLQPQLRILVDDLRAQTPEQIRRRTGAALARLTLFCLLRAQDSDDFVGELGPWRAALRAVWNTADGAAALATVLRYIIDVVTPDELGLRQVLHVAIGPEAEDTMTQTFSRYALRVRAEMLLEQLEERFGPLSAALHERVLAASIDEVRCWARRVLTAPSLEAVFAEE